MLSSGSLGEGLSWLLLESDSPRLRLVCGSMTALSVPLSLHDFLSLGGSLSSSEITLKFLSVR